ncbi:hypothetical protein [Polyangium sorediatum]|uniref:Lipoprotein n=1 Tax=Polyangium sorediatum TaxID=889274 RepID=A0ABT6NMK6_9BACT|nr:hypothetical protein [Polyangium sorediatum]MDI1429549.1 hypothetical protein [Polyangium sorediatum]
MRGLAPAGRLSLAPSPAQTVQAPLQAPAGRDGDVGSPDPLILEAHDPAGRWVILCQPREDTNGDGQIEAHRGNHGGPSGDDVDPYLILGSGAGQPIDQYVAHAGSHVAVIRDGKLVVVDVEGRTETVVPRADVTDDNDPFSPHRTAVFDAAGRTLAYLATKGERTIAIVRDLASGVETEVDPGPGRLWRIELPGDDSSIAMQVVVADTNGDGILGWPIPATSLSHRRCRTRASHCIYSGNIDTVATRIVSLATGQMTVVPPIVAPLGDRWIVREEAPEESPAALFLVSAEGIARPFVSAACDGDPFYLDHGRKLALVVCRNGAVSFSHEPERMRVELHGEDVHWPLGVYVQDPRFYTKKVGTGSVVLLWTVNPEEGNADPPDVLVDMEHHGVLHPFPEGARALSAYDRYALYVSAENKLMLRDRRLGEDFVLRPSERNVLMDQVGRFAHWGSEVFDLERGVVGEVSLFYAMVLTTDGWALGVPHTPEDKVPERNELWRGPLRWAKPKPEPYYGRFGSW